MKTLKEYLTESKKVYDFKVKVAGDVPESFQENLKTALERCKVLKLEKISTTPIQSLPLDFPLPFESPLPLDPPLPFPLE